MGDPPGTEADTACVDTTVRKRVVKDSLASLLNWNDRVVKGRLIKVVLGRKNYVVLFS